ncbi:MGH1-like glycoside hydrolase domain-containing protein [Piscinibacter sakaiensis]|uniref:MGH1-like glycoside hydrolase domain-containing protein n=1 Tax=Piscinibacter sakaiensis TaxID=1547922 RepID=UPI003AAA3BEF
MAQQEKARLQQHKDGLADWQAWGPYLSERSWGTVREDYSADGSAWSFLTHEMARSKAYRWGEDGLAGFCDRYQLLCFSLALWNGADAILKERAFGLTSTEGNHGEDLKEYYFYLDSTPTHSYMRYLYKYPQAAYPYQRLIDENRSRGGKGPEFELLDTGIFDDDRYFDVFVEYAKAGTDDICIRIEAFNRGPDAAWLHLLPQLWFRNIWGWGEHRQREPLIERGPCGPGWISLLADETKTDGLRNLPFRYQLGPRRLYAQDDAAALFTDNESNLRHLYGEAADDGRRWVKDAFHRQIVDGEPACNPAGSGTKAGLHYHRFVEAGGSTVIRLRLTPALLADPLLDIDRIVAERLAEADEFYAAIHPANASADERLIQRQAFAGMMWSKQNYIFDVELWLKGDNPKAPPPESRKTIRNEHWNHLNSMRVLSMPDKWEYPWFAAWDLAFHTVAIALIDGQFAKEQLWFMLFEQFQHPNGQIPAYEWEFSDLNPPVHPWAVWRVYNMDRIRSGKGDREFLERCFQKLLINFAWWINKVDHNGNNIFEGGFLGLDNITLFDRSEKLPGDATLEQSDATGWMGFFCLVMMRIALELAKENRTYEWLASKFFQHYVYVGAAMKQMGGRDHNLWDEEDGFFYDVLQYPDGRFEKLRVRSLVGLIPLYAVERLDAHWIEQFSDFSSNVRWFLENRRDLVALCVNRTQHDDGNTLALTIVDLHQLRRILQRVADGNEFLSPFGLRSLSKWHAAHPFVLDHGEVRYEPAEAVSKIKGGNSNWRGPIWFPTTFLMIESLRKLATAYGDDIVIDSNDGRRWTIGEIAEELANGMISIFTRGADGRRPGYGTIDKFQHDPHWRDHLSFHEYFDGDTGAGLGASHQTGWTGLVASLIDEWRG